MASNEKWEDWVEQAIACPSEWEFGTRLEIDGRLWTCMDHGEKIVFQDGIPWIDMLTPNPPYPYGSIVEAKLYSNQSLLTVKP